MWVAGSFVSAKGPGQHAWKKQLWGIMYFLQKCMTSCPHFTKGRRACTSTPLGLWGLISGSEKHKAYRVMKFDLHLKLDGTFCLFASDTGLVFTPFMICKVTWRCFESIQMEPSLIWNICMGAQHSGDSRQWSSNWNRGHWSLKEAKANAREPESLENKLSPSPKSVLPGGPWPQDLLLIC